MEKRRNLPRICLLLTAALTLLGVALRSVCMLGCFDTDIGYFAEGPLPLLSNVLYFAAVLIPTVCMAITPKDVLPTELHTPGRAPAAILLGLSLAVFTIISLLICFPARKSNTMLASSLLGLLASTYYFLSARRDGRYPDWLSFLGFLPAIWSIAAVADTYFDQYTTMNSPVKIALQMGFIGFMMISLAELRFRVGKVMPRYSVAFLAVGSYACLVGSIPLLIAACVGIVDQLRHTMYASVLLCAGLYGFYLLFRYTVSPAPSESPAESLATPNTAE